VTEEVTGIDLVREQLRIASGERLRRTGPRNADRARDRVPAERRGPVTGVHAVGRDDHPLPTAARPGVRVDTHAFEGYRIPPNYDSLLAKVVIWGEDRETAIARAQRSLAECEVEGVATTRDLFRDIVQETRFRSGTYTTAYLDDAAADLPHLSP
jgi:acetyl-CoA carboxylase biotin carboxylase subunit